MFHELSLFRFYSGQLSHHGKQGVGRKGFRCCTIGLRLFRVYSASVSELDAGERAARAAATALAVSWSMKIDQCIVLRDTSKAKRSSLPTSRCSSHGTNIYSLTPLSLSGKRSRILFFFFRSQSYLPRLQIPRPLIRVIDELVERCDSWKPPQSSKKKRKVEQQTTDIFLFYLYNN